MLQKYSLIPWSLEILKFNFTTCFNPKQGPLTFWNALPSFLHLSFFVLPLVKIFQGPYLKIPIFLTSLRRSNWKDRIRHWHWKWGQKWDGQKSKLKHQQHNIIRSKSKSGIGLSLVTSFGIALVSMLENVVNAISRWQFVDANTGSPRYSRKSQCMKSIKSLGQIVWI